MKFFSSPNSPGKLVHLCIDKLFHVVRFHISQNGFKNAVLQLEPFLKQLPRELQTLLIQLAEKNLDHTYTIRTLLTIWCACIENAHHKEITTPRYLYNDEEGRKCILRKLGTLAQPEKINKVSLFMYSFYSHLSVKIGSKGAEFLQVEDDQLQDPRLMIPNAEQEMLSQVLSHLVNLSSLIMPTIANSQLLEVIAMNMHGLKCLDISCSTNATDYGLMALVGGSSRCKQSLQQLHLEGTSTTTDGIFILLANLPSLELLDSSLLERALDQITPDKTLNLRKITVGRFWRANDILKNLPQVCSKLTQIILLNVPSDQCVLMGNFAKLAQLKHVHIGQVKIDPFVNVLTTFGNQLITLTYSNFSESVNLGRLIQHCPNLECFGLNAGSIICDINDDLKMPVKLSEIRLNVHAHVAAKVWRALFSQCHQLIYVDMTPGMDLTDDNLQEIMNCDKKALVDVRSFIIRGRHRGGDVQLTEKTIEALMSRCQQLKCIGDCSTWAVRGLDEFFYFM